MVDTRKYNSYRNEFNKKTYRIVGMSLNREKDAELLEYLDTIPNVTNYLRTLVLEDMKKKKEQKNKSTH